jgi:hypothetical protein
MSTAKTRSCESRNVARLGPADCAARRPRREASDPAGAIAMSTSRNNNNELRSTRSLTLARGLQPARAAKAIARAELGEWHRYRRSLIGLRACCPDEQPEPSIHRRSRRSRPHLPCPYGERRKHLQPAARPGTLDRRSARHCRRPPETGSTRPVESARDLLERITDDNPAGEPPRAQLPRGAMANAPASSSADRPWR